MDYRSSRGHWWLHHAWWSTLGTTTNHDPSSVLVALSLVKRWAGVTWDSGVWEKDMEIWWWTKSFNAGSSWAGESAHLYTVSYGKFGCFFSFAVFFWIFFAHASTPPIYRARWYIKLESIRCADVTRKLMSKDEYGCCLNMLDIVGFERVWIWTDVHIVIEYEMYIYIYIHASCTYTYRPSSKQGKHADLEVQSILCESFLQHCVAFLRVRLSVALVVDDHAVPISWLAGIWARAFWWRGGGSGWSGGQTHREWMLWFPEGFEFQDSFSIFQQLSISRIFDLAFIFPVHLGCYLFSEITSQGLFYIYTRLLRALDSLLWPVEEPHEHVDVVDEGAPDSPAAPVNSSIEVTGLTGWTGWIGDMLD